MFATLLDLFIFETGSPSVAQDWLRFMGSEDLSASATGAAGAAILAVVVFAVFENIIFSFELSKWNLKLELKAS